MASRLTDDAPSPRLCVIVKSTPTQEYGYNLHAEKGKPQFIGAVDPGSPADRAGLRPGDRIFAVNGHNIAGENHKQVVQRIKEDPHKCELLVITEDGAEWYKKHDIPITLTLPNIIRNKSKDESNTDLRKQNAENVSPTPAAHWYAPKDQEKPVFTAPPPPAEQDMSSGAPLPRLCILQKSKPTDEFGFNLHAEKNRGHFVGAVDKDGIGERAGLQMGQRIVGVNGQLIYPTTAHKEVVLLIKMNPLRTELLVASEEVDRWYSENHAEYSFSAVEKFSPLTSITHYSKDSHSDSESSESVGSEKHSRPHTPEIIHESVANALEPEKEMPTTDFSEVVAPKETHSQPLAETLPPQREPTPPPKTAAAPLRQTAPPPEHRHQGSMNGGNNKTGVFEEPSIFSLSAMEARSRLVHRKKDPRRDGNMTLDEKYRLVSNM